MNVQVLEELILFLKENPTRLVMGREVTKTGKDWTGNLPAVLVRINNPPAFSRCAKIKDYHKQWAAFEKKAAEILGIDCNGTAERLFQVMAWPDKLRTLRERTDDELHLGYWEIDDPVQMVELVERRLRSFIDSDGKR